MHVRGSILVVDDEPTIGEVVSAYLRRAGYETASPRTGPPRWPPSPSARRT